MDIKMAALYLETLNYEIKATQAMMRQLKDDKSIPVAEMNIRYEELAKRLKGLKRRKKMFGDAVI